MPTTILWFIHGPKHHKENQLLSLELSCWVSIVQSVFKLVSHTFHNYEHANIHYVTTSSYIHNIVYITVLVLNEGLIAPWWYLWFRYNYFIFQKMNVVYLHMIVYIVNIPRKNNYHSSDKLTAN